jgi:SAM-dependent methyltransferase
VPPAPKSAGAAVQVGFPNTAQVGTLLNQSWVLIACRVMKRPIERLRNPLNASRVHLDEFVRRAGQSVARGSFVLDAGAGDAIYRHHFDHAIYETADFARVDKPYATDLTYVCDLTAVPVADARYDLVVLTQVLEHLPNPMAVLHEMRRVLKPTGQIWATCPLFYEEHEQPYDYYRYTQFALRLMFPEAGFADPDIDWLEGYLATIAYQLMNMGAAVPGWCLPVKVLLKLLSEMCARSDLRRKRTDIGYPKNYTIVATVAAGNH